MLFSACGRQTLRTFRVSVTLKDNLTKAISFSLYSSWYLGCMIILVAKYTRSEASSMVCTLSPTLILYLKRKPTSVRGVVEACSALRKIGLKLKRTTEKLRKSWSKRWKFKWFKSEFFLITSKSNIEETYISGGEMRDFLTWSSACVYMKQWAAVIIHCRVIRAAPQRKCSFPTYKMQISN